VLVSSLRALGLLALAALVATGCATPTPRLPPLETGTAMLPGKVIWHDLVTPNMAQAKAFYGDLFGWTFEHVSSGYALARSGDRLVGGIAKLNASWDASYWIPLVSVPDVDQAVIVTTEAGGETLLEPFDLPGRGRVAVIRDPHGAAFAVARAAGGDPVDRPAALNDWLWNEVWTDDVARAGAFYESLLGYRQLQRSVHGTPYVFLAREGRPRVGLMKKPDPEIGNTWVGYLQVADASAITVKAESLGGKVLLAPTPDVRNGTIAILADPSGAGFVVQERKL